MAVPGPVLGASVFSGFGEGLPAPKRDGYRFASKHSQWLPGMRRTCRTFHAATTRLLLSTIPATMTAIQLFSYLYQNDTGFKQNRTRSTRVCCMDNRNFRG